MFNTIEVTLIADLKCVVTSFATDCVMSTTINYTN